MTKLTLTSRAATKIYAATCSIVVDYRVGKKARKGIPDCVSVFVLQANGVVSCTGKKDSTQKGCVPFIGLPYGLLGLIGTTSSRALISEFTEFAKSQSPQNLPEVLELSTLPLVGQKKVALFLNKLLAREISSGKASFSAAERQLVELREKNEQLSLGFEKARRMIVGAGYSTRTICFDLPAGNEAIGPKSTDETYSFSQVLPVDLASFTGVSLHIAMEAAAHTGTLQLLVRRRSDSAIIGASEVPYASLKSGWHHFALPGITGRTFGDGILQLEWQGQGGPKLSLTSELADRFGTDAGRSLALRIERGLTEPSGLLTSPHMPANIVAEKLDAKTIAEHGCFFGGSKAEAEQTEKLGFEVIRLDEAGRWVQTHVLKDGIAALCLQQMLAVGTVEARARVSLPHRRADACIAFLMTGIKGAPKPSVVEDIVALGETNNMDAAGTIDGVQWSAKILGPGSSEFVSLVFDKALGTEQDLLLGVMPLASGRNGFGWCRWQSLTLQRQVKLPSTPVTMSADQLALANSRAAQMRVHRFPEIADQISFYQGQQTHIALREKLGFWPVEFSDDTGAMQLHPLNEGVCAAVLESGLPENVRRIACDIGTAHGQADDFIYVLGVLPDNDQMSDVITKIASAIKQGAMVGQDETGVEWSAVKLAALEKRTLELILEEPSKRGKKTFCMTLPVVDGKTSYGWCRWYLLSFEMVPFEGTITMLATEPQKEVVGE